MAMARARGTGTGMGWSHLYGLGDGDAIVGAASAEKPAGWHFPWSHGMGVMCRGRPSTGLSMHLRSCTKGRLLPVGFSARKPAVGGWGDGDGRSGGGGDGGGGGGGDGFDGKRDGLPAGMALFWSRYLQSLDRNPVLAKSLTTGVMNALADMICQVGIENTEKFDVQRLLSFIAIGLCITGPGMHYWYGLLPKLVPASGLKGLALRIAADQLVFTPLGMLNFFVLLLTLEGRPHQIPAKLEKDLFPTVVANWRVWIPFQLVNFGIVPPQLQVPAAGLLGMVWTIFISFKGHT